MILRRVARQFVARSARAAGHFIPTAVVLVYHRVASPKMDPQLLCVSPDNFADHLRVIGQLGACVPLRRLVQDCALGRVPKRGIVVTFDDGYADNLKNAEPILSRAGVPATVFVSTGGLESRQPFWWDELESLLLSSRELPPELSITARGRRMHWDMQWTTRPESASARWDVTQPTHPTARHAAYRDIHSLCRGMQAEERENILEQMRRQLTGRPAANHAERLTLEQVADLARSDVVEVGAHGVTHAVFRAANPEQSRRELQESRRRLTEVTGRGIDLFAYPFGARSDLPASLPGLVRDCGFMAACANWPGLVWWRTDPYRIPRHVVRDWGEQEFAGNLQEWMNGAA